MIDVSGDIIYHDGKPVALIIMRESTARERFMEELEKQQPTTFARIKRDLDRLIKMQKEQLQLLTGDDT